MITGFNTTSTLMVGVDNYTSSTNDNNDVIIAVNDNQITLKGAASLSEMNIVGADSDFLTRSFTENRDTIVNNLLGATINALGGDDTITNTGDSVSVDAGKGDDTITNTETTFQSTAAKATTQSQTAARMFSSDTTQKMETTL